MTERRLRRALRTVRRDIRAMRAAIAAHWSAYAARANARGVSVTGTVRDCGPSIFGGSVKTDKAVPGMAVRIIVSYFAPHILSGRNVCPWAALCPSACLGEYSGHLAAPKGAARNAQHYRVALYYADRVLFRQLALLEASEHTLVCSLAGDIAAIRCDGTSDLGEGARIAAALATNPVTRSLRWQAFDYTKSIRRAVRERSAGWHLTYSADGIANETECREALRSGVSVAIVADAPRGSGAAAMLAASPLAQRLLPLASGIVDGDAHDYRPADPAASLVLLAGKGGRVRVRDAGLSA